MRVLAVDLLLALGLVVLAPTALRLQGANLRPGVPSPVAVPAGGLAAASLFLPAGGWAVAMAVPWLGVAGWSAAVGLRSGVGLDPWSARGREAAGFVVGRGYHVVGAAALLLDRAGADPLGTGAAIVTLTAVHFHFSGLMALTVVSRTFRVAAREGRGGWLTMAIGVVAVAPVPIALGFVVAGWLQLVGAVLLTAGLLLWSVMAGAADGGRLWAVARVSVWGGMALAVWYAAGAGLGLPGPSIPVMAASHGVLNGLGFAGCAVAALWRGDRAA